MRWRSAPGRASTCASSTGRARATSSSGSSRGRDAPLRLLGVGSGVALGERAEARSALDLLAARGDLDTEHHVRALVERGVVEAEDGALDAAERSLSLAAGAFEVGRDRERLDPALLAKARYWLGEVGRARFLAVKLDPAVADAERLGRELEAKSDLLLAAQGHYVRAMRAGDARVAVAAGGRVGELYETLHAELTAAPLPPGLDEEGGRAYRAELRQRVRVLVAKAIEAYEETLAAARRSSVESDVVERVEAALARMRRALADVDAVDADVAGEPAAGSG